MKKLTDICDIQYGYAFDSKCFTEDSNIFKKIYIYYYAKYVKIFQTHFRFKLYYYIIIIQKKYITGGT